MTDVLLSGHGNDRLHQAQGGIGNDAPWIVSRHGETADACVFMCAAAKILGYRKPGNLGRPASRKLGSVFHDEFVTADIADRQTHLATVVFRQDQADGAYETAALAVHKERMARNVIVGVPLHLAGIPCRIFIGVLDAVDLIAQAKCLLALFFSLGLQNLEIAVIPEKFPGTAGMKKTYWEQVQLPAFFKARKVEAAYFPYPSNPWKGFSKPVVVTVHDTIPWTMPEYRKSVSTRLYQDRCRNAVSKADRVITVSESSKFEIMECCGVSGEKISVVYNAPAPHFAARASLERKKIILKKYGIEEKDIPAVCSITENKNNPVKISPEILQEILHARL